MIESLAQFLNQSHDPDEIAAMRKKNTIPAWGGVHPHGMLVTRGEGPYLYGKVKRDGRIIEVKDADCHRQILCSTGYGDPEVEAARALARSRFQIDASSGNFLFEIVEWAREVALGTLGPEWRDEYVAHFVTSGTEANDAIRRIARAHGGGNAEYINLREGYSGAGFAANAACGHRPWKSKSTPTIPGMHFTDPAIESLRRVIGDIPQDRYAALMGEAGNYGVGGFGDIPDELFREGARLLRPCGGVYPDEVQTGMGITGRSFWASQTIFKGMQPPEAISAAKGIGAGHRAALVFVRKDVAAAVDGLTYHTFGENLEDLAGMGTVFQIAERDNWTQNAADRGAQLRVLLEDSVRPVSRIDFRVQGRGLMIGIVLDSAKRVNAVLARAPLDGWTSGKGGLVGDVLRVAPPPNANEEFITELAEGIGRTFASEEVERAAN